MVVDDLDARAEQDDIDLGTDQASPVEQAGPVARAAPDAWPEVIDNFAEGVVVVEDATGLVVQLNAAARGVLPGARAGVPAARLGLPDPGADHTDAMYGEHTVRIRRVPLPGARTAWFLRDVTEEARRIDAVIAERSRSRFLAQTVDRLGVLLNTGRTAATVAELAVPVLADLAVVVLSDRRGSVRWWRASTSPGPGTGQTVLIRDHGQAAVAALPAAVRDVLRHPTPVPLGCETILSALDAVLPDGWRGEDLAGAVTLALPTGGVGPAALVLAGRVDGRGAFDVDDDRTIVAFAQRCGLALAAAITFGEQGRMVEAFRSHAALSSLPAVPGMDLAGALRHGQDLAGVGGDFYQAWVAPDDTVLFAVGDVCGKGVQAAGMSSQVRHTLNGLWRIERRPARLVELLNDALLEANEEALTVRFVTGVIGRVTRGRAGDLDVTMAGGGHLPPSVLRHDGTVEVITLRGRAMGVTADPGVQEHTIHLAGGDTLVIVSDGITEARRDGAMFGTDRLSAELRRCAGMPAAAIAERIEMLAVEWVDGDEHDDLMVFAIQAPRSRSSGSSPHRSRSTRSPSPRHLRPVHVGPADGNSHVR